MYPFIQSHFETHLRQPPFCIRTNRKSILLAQEKKSFFPEKPCLQVLLTSPELNHHFPKFSVRWSKPACSGGFVWQSQITGGRLTINRTDQGKRGLIPPIFPCRQNQRSATMRRPVLLDAGGAKVLGSWLEVVIPEWIERKWNIPPQCVINV